MGGGEGTEEMWVQERRGLRGLRAGGLGVLAALLLAAVALVELRDARPSGSAGGAVGLLGFSAPQVISFSAPQSPQQSVGVEGVGGTVGPAEVVSSFGAGGFSVNPSAPQAPAAPLGVNQYPLPSTMPALSATQLSPAEEGVKFAVPQVGNLNLVLGGPVSQMARPAPEQPPGVIAQQSSAPGLNEVPGPESRLLWDQRLGLQALSTQRPSAAGSGAQESSVKGSETRLLTKEVSQIAKFDGKAAQAIKRLWDKAETLSKVNKIDKVKREDTQQKIKELQGKIEARDNWENRMGKELAALTQLVKQQHQQPHQTDHNDDKVQLSRSLYNVVQRVLAKDARSDGSAAVNQAPSREQGVRKSQQMKVEGPARLDMLSNYADEVFGDAALGGAESGQEVGGVGKAEEEGNDAAEVPTGEWHEPMWPGGKDDVDPVLTGTLGKESEGLGFPSDERNLFSTEMASAPGNATNSTQGADEAGGQDEDYQAEGEGSENSDDEGNEKQAKEEGNQGGDSGSPEPEQATNEGEGSKPKLCWYFCGDKEPSVVAKITSNRAPWDHSIPLKKGEVPVNTHFLTRGYEDEFRRYAQQVKMDYDAKVLADRLADQPNQIKTIRKHAGQFLKAFSNLNAPKMKVSGLHQITLNSERSAEDGRDDRGPGRLIRPGASIKGARGCGWPGPPCGEADGLRGEGLKSDGSRLESALQAPLKFRSQRDENDDADEAQPFL